MTRITMTPLACLACCLWLILPWLGSAHAAPTESAPLVQFSGTLDAGQHRAHPLTLASGDYVQGQLNGAGMRLVLLDGQGQRVRVLGKGQREQEAFMFVAGDAGPYQLDVRAPQAGAYQLDITRQTPLSAQIRPTERPDSLRLQAVLNTGDSAAFWRELAQTGTPLVETTGVTPALAADERLVTFVWRGAQHGVRLHGGPSADHDELRRLANTDVWYRSYRLPASTRLAYRLAPDVPELNADPITRRRAILANAQRDPLNPRSMPDKPLDRYDGYSLLELPDAPSAHWTVPRPGVAAGTLETLQLASQALGNQRRIQLYRSAGYRPGGKGQALVVLFDGESYGTVVPTPTMLDNLVAAGRLPPLAAILIHNPSETSRSAELPPNPAFARFLAKELMPWAKARGVFAPAAHTVIAGASYGGLAAVWAGFNHPEWFGNVYSQSGSFWWAPGWARAGHFVQGEAEAEWLTRRLAESPRLPLRFQLEAGLFETGRLGAVGIRDATRHLRDVLRAKGYPVGHREYAAAHGYEHWRVSLADGLVALLGTPAHPLGMSTHTIKETQ